MMTEERKPKKIRQDLSQAVYDDMVHQIKTGELIEQQRVTEYQMAKKLGVSRTPVRKAFRALAADGYLENIENIGVHVKKQPLNRQGFQERIEFIEKLLSYYLFELERKEFPFNNEPIEEIIQQMQEQLTEEHRAFEESCVNYFESLLSEISNHYMQQAIMKAVREILWMENEFTAILQESRRRIFEHLLTLSDYLADNNYPYARREIRILLNQMTLDVIEKS